MARAREILQGFAGELEIDMIMPVPSSYDFAREVAELVCEVTGKEYLDPSFLRKRTVAEMLEEYDGNVPGHLSKGLSKEFKNQLADWKRAKPEQSVSMKRIAPKIRTCFQPLALSTDAPDIGGRRILIVDDLMSSGSSVASTAGVIIAAAECTVPMGITFLSSL
jgi:hypothetical protein